MEKEFIPYEQALALKELGFDEPCVAYKDSKYTSFFYQRDFKNSEAEKTETSIPLYQQAFRWFREKYKLHSFIDIYPQPDEPERCWYMIRYFERGEEGKEDYMSGWFINQEKAEPACLRKLIDIVKEQK